MDNVYFTKNSWDLRLWVHDNVPYRYFCMENWLHRDYPEEDNMLIMAKNIGIIAGKMPECRQHEAISEEEFKNRVGQVLERCGRVGENYRVGIEEVFSGCNALRVVSDEEDSE